MGRMARVAGVGLLLLAALPAAAQDEATQIKQGIEASLQKYAKLHDETLYSFAGIDVAGDGAGYAVTIADVRVAPQASGYLAIGDIRFRLASEGADAYRVSDLALAPRMPYRNSDGTENGALTVGSQQFSGLWSRSLGVLTATTYAYNDIHAGEASGQDGLSIGALTGTATGTDTGGGLWDSQSSFRLADISIAGDGATLSIAGIEGGGTANGVKMAVVSDLFGRLWSILGSLDSPTPPPEFFQVMTDLYSMYAGMDATYRVSDVRFRDAAGVETVALPELGAEFRADGFDRDAGNMDMLLRLSGLRVVADGTVAIGGLELRSLTKGFKVSQYVKLQEQMQQLVANPEQPPGPELLMEMVSGLFTMASGGDTEIRLRDLKYDDPTGAPLFSLAQGDLLAHAEGFDQPMARMSLAINHQGLAATVPDPAMHDFVPHESNFGILFENLPIQDLITQLRAAVQQIAAMPPDQQEMGQLMLIGVLQQALTQAKSQVKLADWRLRSAAASFDLNGLIEASMESMMGAVANAQITVTGLDRMIDFVKAMSGPESGDAAGLDVLRGFSNRETASDGAIIDRYDVAFTPQGQLLINGKEFPLMDPGGGGMPEDGGATMTPDAPPPPGDGTSTGN